MKAEDMPKELLEAIRSQFDSSTAVVKLRLVQRDLQAKGRYIEAMEIAKRLEASFNDVVFRYMEETERQIEKVDVNKMDIPLEDKEKILALGVVMFMACDLIDFAVMDVDDILHKYDKDLRFEMFNDIRTISDPAKKKLKFLQENSDYMKDLVWADRCDDMYEMMRNKARAILKKQKSKC